MSSIASHRDFATHPPSSKTKCPSRHPSTQYTSRITALIEPACLSVSVTPLRATPGLEPSHGPDRERRGATPFSARDYNFSCPGPDSRLGSG
ncbi:UNVERIFIED_CONTAM: hypothetical protein Sangu_3236400 [Sesamum angustifolium]|uniref:Uncharacterized protein n=1 Tax=Sesamum angustifolium TaxID=2727405 RepID=A0AAW2JGJ5_9LAMI